MLVQSAQRALDRVHQPLVRGPSPEIYLHRSTVGIAGAGFSLISSELWLQQARAGLNWLQDLGSLQRREYELEFGSQQN